MSQWRWLETSFDGYKFGEIDKKQLLEESASRLTWIQKRTLHLVISTLRSHEHSPAERMLICQLLVDLQTSFRTSTADSGTLYHEEKSSDASYERNLSDLLCESGDYNGALTLLHRIPRTLLRVQDLNRIVQLGVALCARAKNIPKILGAEDISMISAAFERLDVLVLPYSLLDAHFSHRIDDGIFIKKSFMWPWIRKSVQAQLQDQPGALVDWQPTRLDTQFRDAFGHSVLHAAIYSQDYDNIIAIIKDALKHGQDVTAYLSTAWPSYAPGLTPLACSASSLGVLGLFSTLLTFSGKVLCCGSGAGTTGHEFCALAGALRNQGKPAVKALVHVSTEQKVDISDCCWWAMTHIPDIRPDIGYTLLEAIQQPSIRAVEDAEEGLTGDDSQSSA